MVVDDEESIIQFIKMGLEAEGYTVYSTLDGNENIVEVYIRYLRTKIGDQNHRIICTIRGFGYQVKI